MAEPRIPCDPVPRIVEPTDDPTLVALDAAFSEDDVPAPLSSDDVVDIKDPDGDIEESIGDRRTA